MSSRLGSARWSAVGIFRWLACLEPPKVVKNNSVYEVFHKVHLKSHFLTCNFLTRLLHFWFQISDFLMGLLHFCFLFFLGCPDGFQDRFSTILVALWEPLGLSLGITWASLRAFATLWGFLEATKEPFGSHL